MAKIIGMPDSLVRLKMDNIKDRKWSYWKSKGALDNFISQAMTYAEKITESRISVIPDELKDAKNTKRIEVFENVLDTVATKWLREMTGIYDL